jgi:hypothetical protein
MVVAAGPTVVWSWIAASTIRRLVSALASRGASAGNKEAVASY